MTYPAGKATGASGNRWFQPGTVALAALLLSMSASLGQSAPGVTVAGFLDVQFLTGQGKFIPKNSSSNIFRASVSSDGCWAIEVRNRDQGATGGDKEAFYLTFDGTNTYFVQHSGIVMTIAQGRPTIAATRPLSEMDALAYISSGSYPFGPYDNQRRCQALWLAFGAGNFLRDSKANDMPLPWMQPRLALLAYGYRWDPKLSSDFPYVPLQIEFVRDSKLDPTNEVDRFEMDRLSEVLLKHRKNQITTRDQIWRDGDVAGQFETRAFTNLNGITFPLEFTLTAFAFPTHPRWKYVATVTNVSGLDANQTFQPPTVARVSVHDTRFRFRDAARQVDEIVYDLKKNDSWRAQEDPHLKELFAAELVSDNAKRYEPGRERRLRFVAIACFFMAAMVFPVVVYRRSARKNNG